LKQTLLYYDEVLSIGWQNTFCPLNNDIHVFYFDTGLLDFDTSHFITDEERIKAGRFFQKQDKLNFLYGRSLVRILTGKYSNAPADKIIITAGTGKKPYAIIFESIERSEIKFNLSHSRNGLLIAFSKTQVGCDIEAVVQTKYYDLLADIFTHDEVALVSNSLNPLKDFFKIWTCKEAVLKTNGTGLIDDLKQLEVCKDVSRIQALELQSNEKFFLTGFAIDERFIAAVCYEGDKKSTIRFFDGAQVLKGLLIR